eukprot:3940477-Rhodomonas_salina.3
MPKSQRKLNRCGSEIMNRCGSEIMNRCGSEIMNRCGSEIMNRCGSEIAYGGQPHAVMCGTEIAYGASSGKGVHPSLMQSRCVAKSNPMLLLLGTICTARDQRSGTNVRLPRTQSPVLASTISLRSPYAMSGTDITYGPTRVLGRHPTKYAGTTWRTSPSIWGTEKGHAGTRSSFSKPLATNPLPRLSAYARATQSPLLSDMECFRSTWLPYAFDHDLSQY